MILVTGGAGFIGSHLEVRHSLSSIDQARVYLGYTPWIAFQDGLAATWAWFRQKGV